MEFGEMEENKQSAKIRMAAMDLLSYREFSRLELTNKLAKKFENSPLIEAVISQWWRPQEASKDGSQWR